MNTNVKSDLQRPLSRRKKQKMEEIVVEYIYDHITRTSQMSYVVSGTVAPSLDQAVDIAVQNCVGLRFGKKTVRSCLKKFIRWLQVQ